MILDIDGPRLDGTFLSLNGDVLDRFTIVKGADGEGFRILSARRLGDAVVVEFESEAGDSYLLWATASLEPGKVIWQQVAGPILAIGATTYWTNQTAGAERLIYRIAR